MAYEPPGSLTKKAKTAVFVNRSSQGLADQSGDSVAGLSSIADALDVLDAQAGFWCWCLRFGGFPKGFHPRLPHGAA